MTLPSNVHSFIERLQAQLEHILEQNFVGTYIHGSLGLGGFNEASSDIDLIVVTEEALSLKTKFQLTKLFLSLSRDPYPIEISFLTKSQLKTWQHPCPYDYHYSEYWRLLYTTGYVDQENKTDVDLAAHLTILNHCGVCFKGQAIQEVFPTIPKADYLHAVMADYYDCLDNINEQPVYCILNLLRVFLYVHDGVISSKKQAGQWGIMHLPSHLKTTASKALNAYETTSEFISFSPAELFSLKDYIEKTLYPLR